LATQIENPPSQLSTMFRTCLFLFLSLPLVQGFGVARPAFYHPSTALFAIGDTDPSFSEDPELFVDETIVQEPTLVKEPYFIGDEKPAVITSKKEELSKKAQVAVSDISAKAQDLVNDPKIKEISAKATEFTKDLFGNIFSKVGDKLKEMKKEKEEAMKK
jgi:arsenate reductase-like glutaredoxin family protein